MAEWNPSDAFLWETQRDSPRRIWIIFINITNYKGSYLGSVSYPHFSLRKQYHWKMNWSYILKFRLSVALHPHVVTDMWGPDMDLCFPTSQTYLMAELGQIFWLPAYSISSNFISLCFSFHLFQVKLLLITTAPSLFQLGTWICAWTEEEGVQNDGNKILSLMVKLCIVHAMESIWLKNSNFKRKSLHSG